MSKAQLRTLSAFSCYSKNNIHAVARLGYQYLEFSIILCWFASLYSNSIHCACFGRFSFWNLLLKYDSLLILLTEIHSYFKSHLQINTATNVLYNFQSTPKILLIASFCWGNMNYITTLWTRWYDNMSYDLHTPCHVKPWIFNGTKVKIHTKLLITLWIIPFI